MLPYIQYYYSDPMKMDQIGQDVVFISETRYVYKILTGKSRRKRPFGRHAAQMNDI